MSIIFAIFIFSFLIFIHELGHFVAAKASGVKVNEFSIFMGPAIFKKQKGETLYSIRCIPIGGYCAMEGEDGGSDNPRAFHNASWWKRLIILLAGAFMNFVSGFVLMAIVFSTSVGFIVPVIDSAREECTIVAEDRLHIGDRFLEIDGEKIYLQSDFSTILNLNADRQTHDIVVERDGQKVYFHDFKMERHEILQDDGSTQLLFGFSFAIEQANFGSKLHYAWLSTVESVRNVRLSLQMLFTGKAGVGDMMGPVGIVDQMNQVAESSETWVDALLNLLYFGGFIAINLGVMNLLPIPALDGGRAVSLLITTAVEGITGRELDPKYEGYVHAAGMVLLLILMALIMFKDVFRLVMG